MSLEVTLEVEVRVEHFVADVATESFYPAVNFNVLVQVRPLSETKPAIWEWAHIRSLIRVDSQMIEEIVPFSKPFLAPFVITLQDFDVPLGSRIFIGENPVLFGIWDMLFYLYRSEIKCPT
jgi:hypothetical protein